MGVDTSETLAQRAERLARQFCPTGGGQAEILAAIRALAAANERLERERDALREEWREIAAGLTTDEPEIGELWPMVSEVSGSLTAVRQYFKNEIAAHNATKAQRDAATAALAKAEGERDRLRGVLAEARAHIADERKSLVECDTIPDANEWRDESTMDDLTKEAVAEIDAIFSRIDAALTPAPEAPNAAVREAGSALWTEDHRQKMAQEASAILDEMRQGAPKDGE